MGTDRLAIAPDTPGYGLSDRPAAPATIEDYAAAMSDLCDGLGLEKIDLMGNHTSSSTAVELARQRPNLVRKIVINSALMYTPEDRARYRATMPSRAPATREAAAAAMPELWKYLRALRSDLSEEDAWALFWDMNRDPTHRAWGYAASFEYDFEKALAQTRQPILILNTHDELFEITARAEGVIPNARIQELKWESGTFTVHAEEVAAIIRAFMDR
jgi:pimeloyl-ACP methyl ester carboxylesterase